MKTNLILIIILFANSTILFASDWKKVYGKYVTLEFNPGYESLADSMVNIADRAIPRLCALHGVPLAEFDEQKTRIVLSDAPDVANGYAIGNDIVIYARSSMYLYLWSGPHNWYKMVLEHELGHHVTFRAIKRTANILGMLPVASTPRWFFEGIAQYFAETWTPFRGDLYMKEAVLNGRFTYNSLFNLENGRLVYASGHAYIRYLADQFGDSSLVKLMGFEKEGFFYDFDEAFKSVYKKSPGELFAYFARHMIIYYGDRAADYPVLDVSEMLPAFGYRDLQIVPLHNADSTYLVSSIAKSNHLYITANIVQIKDGRQTILNTVSENLNTKLFVSPDNNFIAYGRWNISARFNQVASDYEWFIYDRVSGRTEKVADNIRVFSGAFTKNNDLILSVAEADYTVLKQFTNPHKQGAAYNEGKSIYTTSMPIDRLHSLEDGSILFEAQASNSQRDLFVLDQGKLENITNDETDNRNAIILSKKYIAFNQMIENNPSIAIFDRDSKKTSVKINQQFPLWLHSFDKRKNEIITTHKDAGAKTIFASIPIDSLLNMALVPADIKDNKKYSSWTKKQAVADSIEGEGASILTQKGIEDYSFPQGNLINMQTLPFPVYNDERGAGLFLTTLWIEAMQRQILAASSLLYFNNWDKSFLSLLHSIKFFDLDFTTAYYHGPGILTRVGGQYTEFVHDYGMLNVGMQRFIEGNPRVPYNINISYSVDRFSDAPKSNKISHHGSGINFGMGYNLPSKFKNIFPKRQIYGNLGYYKSMNTDLDFSVIQASLKAGINLIKEDLGIVSRLNFTKTEGDVSPSAVTGIDQDFSYNIPRDFRNTKTIRGVSKDVFGDRLLWSSTEISYLIAQNTSMKLLFLPVNEVAISAFLDAAQIEDSGNNSSHDVYSYGSEFSIGYGILRFSAGYAQGYFDSNKLNDQLYGRVNLLVDGLF